jgi:hypothetical protein
MMSDLAPFVAAVIRDRVVVDLKDENKALRQKNEALELALHKLNPHRSVQIRDSDGKKIFADSETNLEDVIPFSVKVPLFRGRASVRCKTPDPLWFGSGIWLTLELWIDGGFFASLQDLSFHYTAYECVKMLTADGDEWRYRATIEARDGDDLSLEIKIFLYPDDHAKLLNREQSVDFLPPADRENAYDIEYSLDQEIPLSHLSELCREKEAVIFFNGWECTKGWLVRNLMVPYVPYK